MNYNQVYGKFSSGSASWLDDEQFSKSETEPFSDLIIDYYLTQVQLDLIKIYQPLDLKNKKIMDVGTGRQALAFSKLGVKKVDHFDISKSNIKKFQNYLKKNQIKINSHLCDIADENFAKYNLDTTYDLVYLHGIIQHVKNPILALMNLSTITSIGSVIWLYFYQTGSPTHIYWEAIRRIIGENVDLEDLFNVLKKKKVNGKHINMIMDNVGCSYRHLCDYKMYLDTMNKLGFDPIMKKDVFLNEGKLNLRLTTPACIICFKKRKNLKHYDISLNKTFHITDHFNTKNYIDDDYTLINSISLDLKEILKKIKNLKPTLFTDDLVEICKPLIDGVITYKISDPYLIIKSNVLENFKKTLKKLKNFG